MKVVCDIETDALEDPTTIHCVVFREIDSGDEHIFRQPLEEKEKERFIDFCKNIKLWVGHNFLGYDMPVLNSFYGNSPYGDGRLLVDSNAVIDTLVVSRLFHFKRPQGHSLEAYGDEFGIPKRDIADFKTFDEDIVERCRQDVNINLRLLKKQEPYLYNTLWKDSLSIEHYIGNLSSTLSNSGVLFNSIKAKDIYLRLTQELHKVDLKVMAAFPPKAIPVKEITPKETKHGTLNRSDFRWITDGDLSGYSVGCPFTRIEWQDFNPDSSTQRVERLNAAGWKPYEKTKGHIQALKDRDEDSIPHYKIYGWRVSENNLETLPDSETTENIGARLLRKHIVIQSRISDLEEWLALQKVDGRIHGNFNGIGSWTHRMSHTRPNTANISSPDRWDPDKSAFDTEMHTLAGEMRSLFGVPEGSYMVGTDADSIHLRILAHLMGDDDFTHALLKGKKEDGTDIHTRNAKALGDICLRHGKAARQKSKTFIYSWLNGAAAPKVSQILECSFNEAREAIEQFVASSPGLERLKKDTIPRDARRGFFEGLDGRLVANDSEHLMLAGYLQNGEKIIMSRGARKWESDLSSKKIPYKLILFVHDEWQTEVPGTEETAHVVGKVQSLGVKYAGESLKLNCPMLGNYKIGRNWHETH